MNEELNHQGRKENKTTGATDLRNELGEVVELKLKGSAFGITSKSWESGSAALKVSVCTRLTHHDAAVKTLFSDGDYDVLTNTFQHLRARGNERILLGLSVRPPVFESLLWSNLLDRVRLASRARLVTSNIVTGDQNTVTRDNFTGFQQGEITDKDVLQKIQLEDHNCGEEFN